MPLLLLPLVVLVLLFLWLVLLPVGLVLRYRRGHARQRAFGWIVASNAWLMLASAVLFLVSARGSAFWVPQALPWAALGLMGGLMLGVVGVWRTHFEVTPAGLHYTPDRWLALLMTLVVAARIALGVWQGMAHLRSGATAVSWLADSGSLFAVGGLLLGYYLTYAWALRQRWRAWQSEGKACGD